jgi:hypothetical protein
MPERLSPDAQPQPRNLLQLIIASFGMAASISHWDFCYLLSFGLNMSSR